MRHVPDEMIDMVAKSWIEKGGNAQSFMWNRVRIAHRIDEILESKR
jgi:hypothetical protein